MTDDLTTSTLWAEQYEKASDATREVLDQVFPSGRDLYAAAAAQQAEPDQPDLRTHYAAFALIATSLAYDYQQVDFRRFLGDPQKYPGGYTQLIDDARHLRTLRAAIRTSSERVDEARAALTEAESAHAALLATHRDSCQSCGARRALHDRARDRVTGHPELDSRKLCATCITAIKACHDEFLESRNGLSADVW